MLLSLVLQAFDLAECLDKFVEGHPLTDEITKDEVTAQTPSLVDKIARSTSQFTIDEIAAEIASVIAP